MDPQYQPDKILNSRNTNQTKFWSHEIPREKNLDPRNTREDTTARYSTRPTKPTIARDSLNVAHFILYKDNFIVQRFVSYADVSIYLESSTLNHGKEAV